MKTKNKALLLALCAVSLVTASVLGTMAYLTDNKKVTNTFTVGSVAITMDETKVGVDGKPVDGAAPVKENSYKLVPGQTYTKDPTIHVDPKSEDCYLFVKVENGITDIEANGSKVADQMATNGWVAVDKHPGVYVKMNDGALQIVKGDEDVTVFETLTIDGSVNGDELKKYDGKSINVTAYAVQKAGFEKMNATQIWETAFPTV